MPVSKRLRYEILRRDNHSCRYCGAAAPDVPLTVDHVIPVALGGTDEPNNLIAACRDCNGGKSASAPDAALISDVADDAARWAAAIKQAAAHEHALLDKQRDACAQVANAWKPRHLPAGWENSVYSLLAAGMDLSDMLELVQVAKWARGVDDRWRYFCGCCWKRMRKIQERAQAILAETAPSDFEAEQQRLYEQADRDSKYTRRAIVEMHWELEDVWKQRTGLDLAQCMCGDPRRWCMDSKCMLNLCATAAGALSGMDGVLTLLSGQRALEHDGAADAP